MPCTLKCVSLHYRLEALNERRSGVVQMVKLAEKERDSLEVQIRVLHTWMFSNHCFIQLYRMCILSGGEK